MYVGRHECGEDAGGILRLRAVLFGTLLDFRTTTSLNCEAVPWRARILGHRLLYHSTLGSKGP